MIKIFIFSVLIFLTLSSLAASQQIDPGVVTPDSPFYALDVALDRLRLLLTFNSISKAKLGLTIADERLAEVKLMVERNILDAAQTAKNEHANTLSEVRSSFLAISIPNSTQQIEQEIEIERELEEHEETVEAVSSELAIKIKIKGNVTAEQFALVESILNGVQNITGDVKVEIKLKEEQTKVKIKIETGKNETEIEEEVKIIEKNKGLATLKREKAQEQIKDAQEELNELQEFLSKANLTAVDLTPFNVLLNQSQSHLNKALLALNETDFGEAFGQATTAENLAENAKKILERILEAQKVEVEKNEIEVEIEEGRTKVKVEINETDFKFTLNTTNTTEIISEIASRTGLTEDEINKLLKIEVEEEDLEKATEEARRAEEKAAEEATEKAEEASKEAEKRAEEALKQAEKVAEEIEKEESSKSGSSESSEKSESSSSGSSSSGSSGSSDSGKKESDKD